MDDGRKETFLLHSAISKVFVAGRILFYFIFFQTRLPELLWMSEIHDLNFFSKPCFKKGIINK